MNAMPEIEHPAVERMTITGYPDVIIGQDHDAEACEACAALISRGDTVIEFQDFLFCDTECLTEAFTEHPEMFGARTIKRT